MRTAFPPPPPCYLLEPWYKCACLELCIFPGWTLHPSHICFLWCTWLDLDYPFIVHRVANGSVFWHPAWMLQTLVSKSPACAKVSGFSLVSFLRQSHLWAEIKQRTTLETVKDNPKPQVILGLHLVRTFYYIACVVASTDV